MESVKKNLPLILGISAATLLALYLLKKSSKQSIHSEDAKHHYSVNLRNVLDQRASLGEN